MTPDQLQQCWLSQGTEFRCKDEGLVLSVYVFSIVYKLCEYC